MKLLPLLFLLASCAATPSRNGPSTAQVSAHLAAIKTSVAAAQASANQLQGNLDTARGLAKDVYADDSKVLKYLEGK